MKVKIFSIILSVFLLSGAFSTESVTDEQLERELTLQVFSNSNFLKVLSQYTDQNYKVSDIIFYFGSTEEDSSYQVQIYLTKDDSDSYIRISCNLDSQAWKVSEIHASSIKN